MLNIILASNNGLYGCDNYNGIPWFGLASEDMKFFKKKTMNQTVIMSRKCYQLIKGKKKYKYRNASIMDFEIEYDQNILPGRKYRNESIMDFGIESGYDQNILPGRNIVVVSRNNLLLESAIKLYPDAFIIGHELLKTLLSIYSDPITVYHNILDIDLSNRNIINPVYLDHQIFMAPNIILIENNLYD